MSWPLYEGLAALKLQASSFGGGFTFTTKGADGKGVRVKSSANLAQQEFC